MRRAADDAVIVIIKIDVIYAVYTAVFAVSVVNHAVVNDLAPDVFKLLGGEKKLLFPALKH